MAARTYITVFLSLLAAYLVGCDCVAGGYRAMGRLTTTATARNLEARLCTKPEGGSCVTGDVSPVDDMDTTYQVEVVQISSAGGDQLGECNDKPYLVITADNCTKIVQDTDESGGRAVRNWHMDCE